MPPATLIFPAIHFLKTASMLDLTSPHPYWFVKNGLPHSYPPLANDRTCEVAIVGGGITGAMIAQRLAESGFAVLLLDARDVALGSTSASTALLQYEIDVMLVDMADQIGEESARRAYELSYRSIDELEALVQRTGADCGFRKKTSLYMASDRKKAKRLAEEFRARRSLGFDVRYLDHDRLRDEFHLEGVSALVTGHAASVDPYRFCHALLQDARRLGAEIHDRTKVVEFDVRADHVRLVTNRGVTVAAQQVVIASGYEAQSLLREKVVDLDSTYALVSQPLEDLGPWDVDWMFWEAKEPYLYLRCTDDRRLLAGGEDDAFHDAGRRDAKLPEKVKRLEEHVRRLIPGLEWETEFSWAGTFGTTRDGLAYIGSSPEYPRCQFALGFGGNGITFSMMASEILDHALRGRTHPAAHLFRFGR